MRLAIWKGFMWGCLLQAFIAGVGVGIFITPKAAHGSDYGQWDRSDPITQWYSTLMQPDHPTTSCCGEADAYWADIYEMQGDKVVAIITDPRPDEPLKRNHIPMGTKILVPKNKLKWDQGNPTGHGVIFLKEISTGPGIMPGWFVYCYVFPGGA